MRQELQHNNAALNHLPALIGKRGSDTDDSEAPVITVKMMKKSNMYTIYTYKHTNIQSYKTCNTTM